MGDSVNLFGPHGPRGCRSIQPWSPGQAPTQPYRQIADELRITEDAVKMAVHRLRKRMGKGLRAEIAQTVADPVEVDDEIRYLLGVLRD